MTGFALTQFAPSTFDVSVIVVLFLCIVALGYSRRVARNDTDLFIVVAAVFVTWGILAGPVFYPHYAAFVVPFLVALAAVSIGRLRESLGPRTRGFTLSRSMRRFVSWGAAVGFVGLLVGIVMWTTVFYSSVGELSGFASLNKIPQLIPPGACVVYDNVGYGILENRFFSDDAACPQVIDPIGTRLLGGNETTIPQRGSYGSGRVILRRPST